MPVPWYKFTDKRRMAFIEAIEGGMRRGVAARKIGVHPNTIIRWMAQSPKFKEAVDAAERIANDHIEDALYEAAVSGNVVAIQVWLYNRVPERWGDKRSVQVDARARVETQHMVSLDMERMVRDDEALEHAHALRQRIAAYRGDESGGFGDGDRPALPVPSAPSAGRSADTEVRSSENPAANGISSTEAREE